jgi:hypothetical protein
MFLACRDGMSRQGIGDWWDRDQSTVTYGKQRVDMSCELYPKLAAEVEDFITKTAGFMNA